MSRMLSFRLSLREWFRSLLKFSFRLSLKFSLATSVTLRRTLLATSQFDSESLHDLASLRSKVSPRLTLLLVATDCAEQTPTGTTAVTGMVALKLRASSSSALAAPTEAPVEAMARLTTTAKRLAEMPNMNIPPQLRTYS